MTSRPIPTRPDQPSRSTGRRTAFGLALEGDLPRFMTRHPGAALLLWLSLTLLVLLVLRQLPHWDMGLARLFGQAGFCDGSPDPNCTAFALRHDATWRTVRRIGIYLPYGFIALFLVLLVIRLRAKAAAEALFVPLLALGSALLGPVLVTNVILKGNWGRPRPDDVAPFGGADTFVLPGTWSAQCADNCSFPSGEATFAAWSVIGAMLVSARWRWPVWLAAAAFYLGVSALRVAFGKHFFSDVVMGGFVAVAAILAVNWALRRWRLTQRLAGWAAAR